MDHGLDTVELLGPGLRQVAGDEGHPEVGMVEVAERDRFVTGGLQLTQQVRTDESGRPRDRDSHLG